MKIDGTAYRSVWRAAYGKGIEILDQTKLPHALEVLTLETADAVADPWSAAIGTSGRACSPFTIEAKPIHPSP